jgi:hypothetical protein
MMTAVLSATNALRHDRIHALDDNQSVYPVALVEMNSGSLLYSYSSSSTDWRAKYLEVADMLAETRAELEDFQQSSKELEEELEQELVRTEKAQQDLKIKASKAEAERDEWKVCLISVSLPPFHSCICLCYSPSSCPYKQLTTQPQLLSSVNWISSDKSSRKLKSNYANWKWETMTLNAMSELYHRVWSTLSLSTHVLWRRKYYLNMNY